MKDVYQISDLNDRAILDKGSDKLARLAVIGNPVAHSASPAMHQAALDARGMDMRYIRLEVQPGEVAKAFKRMKELGFIGCNITVPHKLEAKECCDTLSEDARAVGVVNTVSFISNDASITGHNTDGSGLARAIHEDFNTQLEDLRVMIVGVGGGAGKAIATQCYRLGCPRVWLVNRTIEKAQTLANHLRASGEFSSQSKLQAMSTSDSLLDDAAKQSDLIINATSLGMKPEDPLPIHPTMLLSKHMVYDAIYKPAETALLKEAKNLGAETSNGLSMLLHQGVLAFKYCCLLYTSDAADE